MNRVKIIITPIASTLSSCSIRTYFFCAFSLQFCGGAVSRSLSSCKCINCRINNFSMKWICMSWDCRNVIHCRSLSKAFTWLTSSRRTYNHACVVCDGITSWKSWKIHQIEIRDDTWNGNQQERRRKKHIISTLLTTFRHSSLSAEFSSLLACFFFVFAAWNSYLINQWRDTKRKG